MSIALFLVTRGWIIDTYPFACSAVLLSRDIYLHSTICLEYMAAVTGSSFALNTWLL
jgi:hypothetical protein